MRLKLKKRTTEKFDRLKNILRELRKIVVAFSGGVDSTFLLKVARDVLSTKNVLAATALSETTPSQEISDAEHYAKVFGVQHIRVITRELEVPEFVKNPPNKCYICRINRFGRLLEIAKEHDFSIVADGTNADDCFDFRPGNLASRELGIRSPLEEAGLTKKDIRALSKELGLATWNKPSFACLASRIPYYQEITPEKLKQVDKAERFLRETGLSAQLRVRHHGDIARLELNPDDFVRISEKDFRHYVIKHLKSLGFQYIALDLEGYTMGSLNRSLKKKKP